MVDDPAANDDENQNKESSSAGDIAQLVVDGVNVVAGPRPSASVPSVGAAGGGAETAAATVDVAAAAGDAVDAAGAVADAAEGAVSVASSVFGILDGL